MNKINNMKEIFSTRDLTLAATLVTLQFPLLGIDFSIIGQRNQPVGFFKFEDTLQLKDTHQKYTQGLLLIEPRVFQMNMHSLKAQVTNAFTSPHSKILNPAL